MNTLYKGKKFLICQPIIGEINGSTMVTLELCDFFKKKGAEVSVFSYYCKSPAKEYFDDLKIETYVFNEFPSLKLKNFDYVWVHSQTLPISIIESLNKTNKKTKFIFLHMSAADYIPDERPYIYKLEENIADKILFISEETKEKNLPFFKGQIDCAFFRNPAPKEFMNIKRNERKELKKILIVSNHPPEELKKTKEILAKKQIETIFVGENQRMYTKITPQILTRFDCVVTIGKTVQYCLVSGTPVYIYDVFGGPGWLNEKNYKKAQYYNFSGRGFAKKTPEQIAKEIVEDYIPGKKFINKKRQEYLNEYSLEKNIERILSDVGKKNKKTLPAEQISAAKEAQRIANGYFNFGRENKELIRKNETLVKENEELREAIDTIESARAYRFMHRITSSVLYKKISVCFKKRKRT